MPDYNYHTHTTRCHHATCGVRECIESAVEAGYAKLGFSDHSPMPFKTPGYDSGFRMALDDAPGYFAEIAALREEFAGVIEISAGLEVECYEENFGDFLEFIRRFPLDYAILGQHFIGREEDHDSSFNPKDPVGGYDRYVERVIVAAESGFFSYVAHPDVFRTDYSDPLIRGKAGAMLTRLKELGLPIEINRLGLVTGRHYPCEDFFRLAADIGSDVVIGIDAHDAASIRDTASAAACMDFASACGVNVLREVDLRRPFSD